MKTRDDAPFVEVVHAPRTLIRRMAGFFIHQVRVSADCGRPFCAVASHRVADEFFMLLDSASKEGPATWNNVPLFCTDRCCGSISWPHSLARPGPDHMAARRESSRISAAAGGVTSDTV